MKKNNDFRFKIPDPHGGLMITLRYSLISILGLIPIIGCFTPYGGTNLLRFALIIIGTLQIMHQLATRKQNIDSNSVILYYAMFFFLWLVWGIGTMFIFSPDIISASKELSDIFFMFLFGLVMFITVGDDWSFAIKSISITWTIAVIVSALVAVWELKTGQHLENAFVDGIPDYYSSRIIVASTLGNPNNYSAFLLLSLPFVFCLASIYEKWLIRTIVAIVAVIIFSLIVITASRIGLFGFFFFFLLIIILYKKKILYAFTILICLSISIYTVAPFSNIDTKIFEHLWLFGKLDTQDMFVYLGSTEERLNLLLGGLYITVNSLFIGCGPNNFKTRIMSIDMPYSVSVPNPHSFLMEVLSQYGLIVFLSLLSLLYYLLTIFYTLAKNKSIPSGKRFAAITLCAAIPLYIIAGFMNSSYISQPTNWFFFASISAIARCSSFFYERK